MTDKPPWVVFNRGDGYADILPAMRPGTVLEGLGIGLAEAIVRAANTHESDQLLARITRTTREIGDLVAELKKAGT